MHGARQCIIYCIQPGCVPLVWTVGCKPFSWSENPLRLPHLALVSWLITCQSAGPTLKIVAYGVGFIGLAVSACLFLHVASKYVFVRLLRNTRHLQSNTVVHWAVWL